MAQSYNMAYFDLTDDLNERTMGKLNYNLRRICALLQENQDNLAVSNGMSVAGQETTQRYTQALAELGSDIDGKLRQLSEDLQRQVREAEARCKEYADDRKEEAVDEAKKAAFPVGIVVSGRSQTSCPVSGFGSWRLVNQADTDGIYFWERTA